MCRCDGISQVLYSKWLKDFMEAGRKQLAGDLVREFVDFKDIDVSDAHLRLLIR